MFTPSGVFPRSPVHHWGRVRDHGAVLPLQRLLALEYQGAIGDRAWVGVLSDDVPAAFCGMYLHRTVARFLETPLRTARVLWKLSIVGEDGSSICLCTRLSVVADPLRFYLCSL